MRYGPIGVLVLAVCACGLLCDACAKTDISLNLGGVVGYFQLPDAISGYIEEYHYGENVYICMEASDGTGYDQESFRYSHPFDSDERPNGGVSLGISFVFPGNFGLYLEGVRTFSLQDYIANYTDTDSMGQDPYSSIPHEYRLQSTRWHDQLYMKSLLLGAGLQYRIPFTARMSLTLQAGFGRYYANQIFRLEKKEVRTDYCQSNGNVVYSQTGESGFETFGIRYASFYLKPGILLQYAFRPRVSFTADFSFPFSYMEKGYRWSEDDLSDESTVFYPRERFVAGNIMLTLGISFHFQGVEQ